MWYVYFVLCRNNSIYTGVTDNVDSRFKRHKSRTGGWHTRLYPAIELLRVEKFSTKQEALKRERQIKSWRREKKLNLIKFGSPKGKQVRFQPRSGVGEKMQ
jgi:putative endonuclease